MQLNNLKPAWQQFKLLNEMQHIASEEILSMIELQDDKDTSIRQKVLFKVAIFIVITILCQGG